MGRSTTNRPWLLAITLLVGITIGIVASRAVGPSPIDAGTKPRSTVELTPTNLEMLPPAVGVAGSKPLPDRREVTQADRPETADDELNAALARIAELEAEIERLKSIVGQADPKRREFERFLTANEGLVHARLWRDLHELVVDAESFVEDPTRAFSLILRLVDETGVAAAPRELQAGGWWGALHPEPHAPETQVSFGSWVNEEHRSGEPIEFHSQIQVEARVVLEKVPDGWLGQPVQFTVGLETSRSTRGTLRISLTAGAEPVQEVMRASFDWQVGEAYLSRSPWKGGGESREMSPDEFPALRTAVSRLFDRLETRAR